MMTILAATAPIVTPLPMGFSGLNLATLKGFSEAMADNPKLGVVKVSHLASWTIGKQSEIVPDLNSLPAEVETRSSIAIKGFIRGLSECQVLCTQYHANRMGVSIDKVRVRGTAKLKANRIESIFLNIFIETNGDSTEEDVVAVFEEARSYSPLQSCVRSTVPVAEVSKFESLGSMDGRKVSNQRSTPRCVESIQLIDFETSKLLSDDESPSDDAAPDTMMSSIADSLKASVAMRAPSGNAEITDIVMDFTTTADMHCVLSDVKEGNETKIVASIEVRGIGTEAALKEEWECVKAACPVLSSIVSPTPIRYGLSINGEAVEHFTKSNTFRVEL